jgi:hypothetical protein
MGTVLKPITATTAPSTPLGTVNNSARRFLYIKNYVYVPNGGASPVAQQGVLYVAFGQDATPGQNGEYELLPGGEYNWGGPLPPNVGNLPLGFYLPVCPSEYVSVIASNGTVYGAIVTQ